MKKRILVYTDAFLKYSETFIYNQLLGVCDEFEVLVVTDKTLNQDRFYYSKIDQLPFNPIQRIQLLFNPYKLHNNYQKKLRRIIEDFNPHLIHAHFGYNGVKIAPMAKSMNIPLLITFWGSDASKRLNDKKYTDLLGEYFAYPKLLCCSKQLKLNLKEKGFDTSKVDVHYAGVSLDKFVMPERQPISEKLANSGKVIFLQVSRFVPKKGHEVTIRAFKDFLDGHPTPGLFTLRLVGDGPLVNQMKTLTGELKISDRVEFLGIKTSEEVIGEMLAADVLLQHSVIAKDGDMEGLPIAIMEAMAAGLVVVSTYHSGIPEIIEDGVNGFLVKERDHSGYVKCLQQLVSVDNCRINELARRKVLEEFNLALQNEKLRSVYDTMLADRV